jgi:hypothetical protein
VIAVRVLAFVAGAWLALTIVLSAIKTVVVPRAIPVRLSRAVFLAVRRAFDVPLSRARTYEQRDAIMAHYAPYSLLTLAGVWLVGVLLAFIPMFWAVGWSLFRDAFTHSGSSLLTLGFATGHDLPTLLLTFAEAIMGLGLLALLIAYLPTMYTAFSRRETAVALLEVRAGTPPSAETMIVRYQAIRGLDAMDELWSAWEVWFAELQETHTSLAALSFFRSPTPEHSWVTAAGTVLDAASLMQSTIDRPSEPAASICIRGGFIALRKIADFFAVPYDPNPDPDDPISVAREEFDVVYDHLAEAGVPVRADRDQAWRDYKGWRVNYDFVLLSLATLTMAPYAPWISDRSTAYRRPGFLTGRAGRVTRSS